MAKDSTLSTIIDLDVKKAVVAFCKQNGLKLRYLIEKLEDEIDIAAYNQRKQEDTFKLDDVLSEVA